MATSRTWYSDLVTETTSSGQDGVARGGSSSSEVLPREESRGLEAPVKEAGSTQSRGRQDPNGAKLERGRTAARFAHPDGRRPSEGTEPWGRRRPLVAEGREARRMAGRGVEGSPTRGKSKGRQELHPRRSDEGVAAQRARGRRGSEPGRGGHGRRPWSSPGRASAAPRGERQGKAHK